MLPIVPAGRGAWQSARSAIRRSGCMRFPWNIAVRSNHPLAEDAIGIVDGTRRNGEFDSTAVAFDECQTELIILKCPFAELANTHILVGGACEKAFHGVAFKSDLHAVLGGEPFAKLGHDPALCLLALGVTGSEKLNQCRPGISDQLPRHREGADPRTRQFVFEIAEDLFTGRKQAA